MAIEKIYNDPNSGGVSQAVFDSHVHNYRKLNQVGIDVSKTYSGPIRKDILDDQEVFVTDGNDAEAIGITVATAPTSIPI